MNDIVGESGARQRQKIEQIFFGQMFTKCAEGCSIEYKRCAHFSLQFHTANSFGDRA